MRNEKYFHLRSLHKTSEDQTDTLITTIRSRHVYGLTTFGFNLNFVKNNNKLL